MIASGKLAGWVMLRDYAGYAGEDVLRAHTSKWHCTRPPHDEVKVVLGTREDEEAVAYARHYAN